MSKISCVNIDILKKFVADSSPAHVKLGQELFKSTEHQSGRVWFKLLLIKFLISSPSHIDKLDIILIW